MRLWDVLMWLGGSLIYQTAKSVVGEAEEFAGSRESLGCENGGVRVKY